MSIANLLQPNTYNLYCNSLQYNPVFISLQAVQLGGNDQAVPTGNVNPTNLRQLQVISNTLNGFTLSNSGVDPDINDQLTCNISGTYTVGGVVTWEGNNAGARTVGIAIGNIIISNSILGNVGANEVSQVPCCTLILNQGDVIRIKVTQTSGGNLNIIAALTRIQVVQN